MWSNILPLILFVVLGIVVLVIFEVRARKANQNTIDETADTNGKTTDQSAISNPDDGCCGEHLVCERETLLQTNAKIEYYDDEELDQLIGIPAEDYTEEQYQMIREVFNTLQAKDVPGWVRSIQLRNIQLPLDIREEALLIVVERRKA
ncbi:MAG: phospholipase [Paludibacteraceae bacterium]|nr:phospholipase [Paludibacteraceae bacterium]